MKIFNIKYLRLSLILPALLLLNNLQAQVLPPDNFYKHLEGNINKTLNISANLIKVQDTLYGNYYYWYYEHESNDKYISRQIPLQGKMHSPTEFILNEFTAEGSYFDGIIVDANRLEGNWKNEEAGKVLPFEMVEKYPKGTMPFELVNVKGSKTLTTENGSPTAAIEISLLKPVSYPSSSVADSVTKMLYGLYAEEDINVKPENLLGNFKEEYFNKYQEANEEIYAGGISFNWLKISRQNVILNEDYVLSIEFSSFAFTGGAHGLTVNKYHVVDLTNGQKIAAADIFKEGYEEKLQQVLNRKLREENEIADDRPLSSAGFWVDTVDVSKNFYLQKTGIGFYYNNYEIAPYSAGHIDIFIPFEEIKELLKPEGIIQRIYDF